MKKSERATSVTPPRALRPGRAWFCYELNFAERYVAAIYYDELPAARSRGRKQVVEITDEPRGPDGEISLTDMMKKHPLKEAKLC